LKREIRYGKAEIRCYRAYGGRRPLFGTDTTVEVYGDTFLASYTEGDNSNVVATDTMKNFTHAALLEYEGDTHEGWAEHLGRKFLDTYPQMEWLRIRERELPFDEHSEKLFEGPRQDEHGVVELEIGRDGIRSLRGGLVDLRLVKLTGSSFARFVRDRYTTLPERGDRPLYIYCDIRWLYSDHTRPIDPSEVAETIRFTFDHFVSMSIQHLLNEFGQVLLGRYLQVSEVSFEAQNRLWDTSAVAEDDPRRKVYGDPQPAHGLIGLTISR
jgi:urate oxidase